MSFVAAAVAAFHRKFGHPVNELLQEVSEIPYQVRRFRMDRIKEEAREFIEAIEQGVLHKIAREGIDLIYVVMGTLLLFGIPFREAFNIVHRANMDKERHPDGQFGKPIKPEGWVGPDAEMLALMEDGRRYRKEVERSLAQNALAREATVTVVPSQPQENAAPPVAPTTTTPTPSDVSGAATTTTADGNEPTPGDTVSPTLAPDAAVQGSSAEVKA